MLQQILFGKVILFCVSVERVKSWSCSSENSYNAMKVFFSLYRTHIAGLNRTARHVVGVLLKCHKYAQLRSNKSKTGEQEHAEPFWGAGAQSL